MENPASSCRLNRRSTRSGVGRLRSRRDHPTSHADGCVRLRGADYGGDTLRRGPSSKLSVDQTTDSRVSGRRVSLRKASDTCARTGGENRKIACVNCFLRRSGAPQIKLGSTDRQKFLFSLQVKRWLNSSTLTVGLTGANGRLIRCTQLPSGR